jgi:hypothetical protein
MVSKENNSTDPLFLYSDGLQTGRPVFFSRQCKIFLFNSPRQTLGPTQPRTQRAPRDFYLEQSGRCVKLTTRLQLVPRSRKLELYLLYLICTAIHYIPWVTIWNHDWAEYPRCANFSLKGWDWYAYQTSVSLAALYCCVLFLFLLLQTIHIH